MGDPTLPPPKYLSVEEVALELRVSCRVVRHQIWKGALKAKRFGREYRIRRDVLEAYGEYGSTS